MPVTTIAFYGGNRQKDVCFRSSRQEEIRSRANWRDMAELRRQLEPAERLSPWVVDAHSSLAEATNPDRRLVEIGGARETL